MTSDDFTTLEQAFRTLYGSLTNAYWAASTVESKDQIHGAEDIVNGVLDEIDHARILADDASISALTDSIKASTTKLGDLQTKLNDIVHNVAAANSAVQAITQTLTVVGKILAL